MSAGQTRPQQWDRLPDESPKAYRAFLTFRDLGESRTLMAASQTLGKSYSLIRRWSKRHRWEERVWAWDVAQSRQDEAVVRRRRDDVVQQLAQDAFRMWRVAIAYFWSLIDRDPDTGQPIFGSKLTSAIALRFCELSLKILTALAGAGDDDSQDDSQQPATAAFQHLTNAELKEMIAIATQLAQDKEEEQ
jgi:hypothetical protein